MRRYTEQDMYKVLGREMQPSETVEERLEQTYRQICSQKQKKACGHRLWYGAAGTAAAMLAVGIFCVSNPALASQLPLIGHLFEQIGDDVNYPGDYSGVGTALVEESETDGVSTAGIEEEPTVAEKAAGQTATDAVNQAGEESADQSSAESAEQVDAGTLTAENGAQSTAYTQTVGGMTVTLSEVYCNEVALYVTMQLKTEEPMTDFLEWQDSGSPILALEGQAKFSYCDTPVMLGSGELSGKLIDDCTYLGMYRLELADSLTDYTEYNRMVEEQGGEIDAQTLDEYRELIQKKELPEQFDVSFSIDQIIGYRKNPVSIYEVAGVEAPDTETIEQMSDEEWIAWQKKLDDIVPDYHDYPNQYENYWYDGPFSFDLSVAVDHDRTVTVPVDGESEEEFAVSSVIRTPFELLVDYNITTDADTMLLVLDADGKRMSTGRTGGSVNMLAIDDHDVSKVDIYWITWEDFEGRQIKGSYFDEHGTNEEGQTLKDVLDSCCLYHREVVIEG